MGQIAEGDRAQPHQTIRCPTHGVNVELVAAGRDDYRRPELAVGVDDHTDSVVDRRNHPSYAGHERARLHALGADANGGCFRGDTGVADVNVVVSGAVKPGIFTYRDIAGTSGVVEEGRVTDGCVAVATGVAGEREVSAGRVAVAGSIVVERANAAGCIRVAVDVAVERVVTVGGVVAAGGVGLQGVVAADRVG